MRNPRAFLLKRYQNQIPAVERGLPAEGGLYFFHVVADACRTPHIRDGKFIARVDTLQHFQDTFVKMLIVLHLGAVQFPEHPDFKFVIANSPRHADFRPGRPCYFRV